MAVGTEKLNYSVIRRETKALSPDLPATKTIMKFTRDNACNWQTATPPIVIWVQTKPLHTSCWSDTTGCRDVLFLQNHVADKPKWSNYPGNVGFVKTH